jgi:actin-related protein
LFQPSLNGLELDGIDDILFGSIMMCDFTMRNDLLRNICLADGTVMLKGFAPRIEREMIAGAGSTCAIKVVQTPESRCSAWIGGSVLASLSTFRDMVVSRQEYDDQGLQAVRCKCFS